MTSGEMLFLGGLVAMIVAQLWFIVLAFKQHWAWGLGCLFVPFISLVFLIVHFSKAWKPLILGFVGLGITVVATIQGGVPEWVPARYDMPDRREAPTPDTV